jgi:CRISPR-associated protein Cas1
VKRTIFIFSGGELHRKDNTLFFENEEGKRKFIPVENTGEIHIFGEVTINKKLLEFLSQSEIILHFFNYYGYYSGSFYPREHNNSGYMILKQCEVYLNEEKRLKLASAFVKGAIDNIVKVLTYYKNRDVVESDAIEKIAEFSGKISEAKSTEEIMSYEGNARNRYYKEFDSIIRSEGFSFESRTKQPPENRLNALISFGNTMLYTTVLSEIYKTHLDPRIGYLHATNFRRFTLNLDVAEIFKPIIVDRIIFTLLNKQMLQEKHFDNNLGGIYLNDVGRKIFVEEYDKRLMTTISDKGLGRNISYRSIIRRELYKLEKHLMNDKEYKPFIARW